MERDLHIGPGPIERRNARVPRLEVEVVERVFQILDPLHEPVAIGDESVRVVESLNHGQLRLGKRVVGGNLRNSAHAQLGEFKKLSPQVHTDFLAKVPTAKPLYQLIQDGKASFKTLKK